MDNKPRSLPNSKESEMMVLGCMLSSKDFLQYAAEESDDTDFYYPEHKTIFRVLKSAHRAGRSVDVHLACEVLKQQGDLKDVGGAAYITTLAQYAGTSAYIEEYVDGLKDKSLLRNLILQSQEIQNTALDAPENAMALIEKYQHSLKEIESRYGRKLPQLTIEDRLHELHTLRSSHQGKKYLGLRVKSIEEFNEKLLGLRKLNLLAAAPNIGKTALTIQLALEVLINEPDACLAYFSLEMTSLEIFTRMHLYLSEITFQHLIFGSKKHELTHRNEALYSEDEFNRIAKATEIIKKIGNRLQIIDTISCPFIDARNVINYVEALKNETECSRAIVVIDYLQVWPTNHNLRFPSENEVDKWRMGEMKKIRDAMRDDPVIVISEARKPSGSNEVWGGELSDVMGSARGTYTPDVVLLLSQLKLTSLEKMWEKNMLPKDLPANEDDEGLEEEKQGVAIKNFLAKLGIAICKLDVPKARDGMQKFSILLEFHFQKNFFKKVNWEEIRDRVEKYIQESNTSNLSKVKKEKSNTLIYKNRSSNRSISDIYE